MNLIVPKFRVWSKASNKMLYNIELDGPGSEYYFKLHPGGCWQYIKEKVDTDNLDSDSMYLDETYEILFSNKDAILLCSTGLFDKTKRKIIFEGDILESNGGTKSVVKYMNNSFNLEDVKVKTCKESGVEYITNNIIIGNIYENPENMPVEF